MIDIDPENPPDGSEYEEAAISARISAVQKIFREGDAIRKLDTDRPHITTRLVERALNEHNKPFNPKDAFKAAHSFFREPYDAALATYEAAKDTSEDLLNNILIDNQTLQNNLEKTLRPARKMLELLERYTRLSDWDPAPVTDLKTYIQAVESFLGIESTLAIQGLER